MPTTNSKQVKVPTAVHTRLLRLAKKHRAKSIHALITLALDTLERPAGKRAKTHDGPRPRG